MNDGFAFISLMVIAGCVGGGIMVFRHTVLSWAERQWRRTGQPIHFGPVGATCYGTEPTASYRNREGHYGALGVVGEHLVFSTRSWERFMVPLASITWLGQREIKVAHGKGTRQASVVMIHGEHQNAYYVYALASDDSFDILQQVSARCRLPIKHFGGLSESRGPATVTHVTQDIYGEWHAEGWGSLYLAPDRLLLARLDGSGTCIFLTQIREIGAFSKGGVLNSLNPFAEDLLRVEYQPPPDEPPQVIGFLVRDGDIWAESIHVCSPARITVHAGRKKKVG